MVLGDRIEAQLADDRPAFHLFLLLRDGMTAQDIMAEYGLSETQLFASGRRLEKIGLVEVMPMGRIRLRIDQPIQFRRDGPLHRTLMELNLTFVRDVFLATDTEQSAFFTKSRRISETSARHIMERLQRLNKDLSELARQDQMTLPEEALQSYKLSAAWAPVTFTRLLSLEKT